MGLKSPLWTSAISRKPVLKFIENGDVGGEPEKKVGFRCRPSSPVTNQIRQLAREVGRRAGSKPSLFRLEVLELYLVNGAL